MTHTHYDHILDVPHIAIKTHAAVIGTESTENVMRAYDVPEEQLFTVRGGEDYQFGGFSLKVIPSIHSPLDHKHYFGSASLARNESAADPSSLLKIQSSSVADSAFHVYRLGSGAIWIACDAIN